MSNKLVGTIVPETICKRIKLQKTRKHESVKVKGKELKEVDDVIAFHVNRVMVALDLINSLEEDAMLIWSKPIDKVLIPNEYKDLVLPNSVRYDSADRRCDELLVRVQAADMLDVVGPDAYEAFRESYETIRNWCRIDNVSSSLTPLSELRLNKSLSDYADKVNINGLCKDADAPYYPITLKGLDDVLGGRRLNAETSSMIKRYFDYWKLG